MTSTGVRTAEHPESNGDCMTAVASLLVGAGFFSLWFWLLPGWLGFHVETTGAARWRWIAAVPSVLGFAVALRCDPSSNSGTSGEQRGLHDGGGVAAGGRGIFFVVVLAVAGLAGVS